MAFLKIIIFVFVYFFKHTLSQPYDIELAELSALENIYESVHGIYWNFYGGIPWNFSGHHNPCLEGWQGIKCSCTQYSSNIVDIYYYYPTYDMVLKDNCTVIAINLGQYKYTYL